MFEKLYPKRQTGLMPRWPAGRGIEDVCGFFAAMSLLVGVGTAVLGYFWPSLGQPTSVETMFRLTLGLALGSVWVLLRLDKLHLARIALVLDFCLLVGVISLLGYRIISGQAGQLNGPWPAISLLFCFIVLFLLWLAQREVGRELNRRSDREKV